MVWGGVEGKLRFWCLLGMLRGFFGGISPSVAGRSGSASLLVGNFATKISASSIFKGLDGLRKTEFRGYAAFGLVETEPSTHEVNILNLISPSFVSLVSPSADVGGLAGRAHRLNI